MHSRRRLSNVRLTKKHHLHYMGWWILLSVVNLLLLTGTIFMLYAQIKSHLLSSSVDVSVTNALVNDHVLFSLFGLLVVATISVVALAFLTAHRIAGPYLALVRTFRQIRKGDLSTRLHFRDYDHLTDVETEFNEMMDRLQERALSGEKGPKPVLRVSDARAAS